MGQNHRYVNAWGHCSAGLVTGECEYVGKAAVISSGTFGPYATEQLRGLILCGIPKGEGVWTLTDMRAKSNSWSAATGD